MAGKKRGAPFRAVIAGKRLSKNVEDLRNDPTGGNKFIEGTNPKAGDMTFYPPVGSKVLPYNDPEGDYNQAKSDKALKYAEELNRRLK